MQKRLHAGCQAITEHDRHALAERRQIRERLDRLPGQDKAAAAPPLAEEHEVGDLLEVLVD
jgi:hypothetical protein